MRRVWLIIGVAGLGMPAAAGHSYYGLEVSLTFDRTSIGIGETAVATMTASWDNWNGTYLSYVSVDLVASGAFVAVSEIAPVAWNNPVMGFNGQGVASGADIVRLNASQISVIPPYSEDNPILITTFLVTGVAEGLLSYYSMNAAGAPYPYYITDRFNLSGAIPDPPGNEVFVSQTLVVTPGPGTAALFLVLGLGGLGRRRR